MPRALRKSYAPRDFIWTRWKPADIRRAADTALRLERSAHAAVKAIPEGERTFENTMYPLECASAEAGGVASKIGFLMQVHPQKGIREAAKAASLRLDKAFIDLEYDEGLYRAVVAYAKQREALPPPEKKLLRDALRGYRRMGFGFPRRIRDRVKANLKRLSAATTSFSKNINDWKDHIAVSREELDGLSERYVAGLKRDKRGRYLVTIEYPDSVPFMQYARSAERREELARKLLRKGGPRNMRVLAEMLRLRRENARLLGYKSHADYRTEVRMAKRGGVARAFVDRLMRRLRPALRRDLARLTALKREIMADPRARIEHYDTAFYGKRLEEREFRINTEAIREYFPLGAVLRGTFAIYEKLLGIRISRAKSGDGGRFPLWYKDVDLYRVDNKGGGLIGYFALDLYPREGKYGHAAAFTLAQGRRIGYSPSKPSSAGRVEGLSGEYAPPLDAMVANFPKPRPGHPSLLSHDEVETFFHEFGHVMHATLTTSAYASQAGSSVAWDFVEAPSQMFEYWVWNRRTLNMLSGHYRHPRRKLPPATLRNLLRSKYHLVAHFTFRQLTYALFDLTLHGSTRSTNSGQASSLQVRRASSDPAAFYRALVRKYFGIALPKDAIFPAGFGHLTEYDAGYYGYLWSRVYAADMATRFQRGGLLNPKIGRDYRRNILEVGSSREEMDSVKAFLGRKPNDKAFLKEITPKSSF